MKISVIVPAYNEEKNIKQCLESLVNQDFDKKEYEIILVNNNSTDKTKEIALGFKQIKIIDEPKQGYGHALIRGCKEAQGKIFVFTDGDTIVPKNWLENYWQAYQNEKVVGVGGPGKFRPTIWQTTLLVEPFLYLAGLTTGLVCGFNFSIRKKTYFAFGGFDQNINLNVDSYLQIKAKELGKTVFLKDNFVITSSRRFSNLASISYILKGLINNLCLILFKKVLFYEFDNIREK